MGIKRPLEAEFPEPSFSLLPKQIDYNKRLNLNIDDPCIGAPESYLCKLQYDEPLENGDTDGAHVPYKESEACDPISLVTSTSSEEDSRDGPTSFWPYFQENDLTFPRRPPEQFKNPYTSLLNGPPRKEVPVGPDYQAEIPTWDPNAIGKQELMGICIIPMPDLNDDSPIDICRAGRGRRTDCNCMDMGSMRCVQQHVNEVREKLRDSVGDEHFVDLGFNQMGEVVARKWARQHEQVFHEIVVSNRVAFLKQLRAEFPTREMKELVSYYFNVFLLRRRAVQNRSFVLEIDSDDEEEEEQNDPVEDIYPKGFYSVDRDYGNGDDLQCQNGECYFVGGEEDDDEDGDDSTVESFGDEDVDASWVDEFWSEPEKIDGENKTRKQNNGIIGDTNVDEKNGFENVHDEPGFNLE